MAKRERTVRQELVYRTKLLAHLDWQVKVARTRLALAALPGHGAEQGVKWGERMTRYHKERLSLMLKAEPPKP